MYEDRCTEASRTLINEEPKEAPSRRHLSKYRTIILVAGLSRMKIEHVHSLTNLLRYSHLEPGRQCLIQPVNLPKLI